MVGSGPHLSPWVELGSGSLKTCQAHQEVLLPQSQALPPPRYNPLHPWAPSSGAASGSLRNSAPALSSVASSQVYSPNVGPRGPIVPKLQHSAETHGPCGRGSGLLRGPDSSASFPYGVCRGGILCSESPSCVLGHPLWLPEAPFCLGNLAVVWMIATHRVTLQVAATVRAVSD